LEQISREVDASVQKLHGQNLTVQLIEDAKRAWVSTMRHSGRDPLLRYEAKEMLPSYRGQSIKVVVTSPLVQYLVVVESCCRGLAVDSGTLRALRSESELAGVERSASVTVDAFVAQASACSRHTVAEQLEDDAATSEAILEVLKR
jgi:hypothetical protein